MSEKENTGIGQVKISTDVILTYVSEAVLGTHGVHSLAGGITDALQKNILGRENKQRGIKIDNGDEGFSIDIYVIIDYGERIPDIAWDIQRNVKKALEDVMDIEITGVNIHVQGVSRSKPGSGAAPDSTPTPDEFPEAR